MTWLSSATAVPLVSAFAIRSPDSPPPHRDLKSLKRECFRPLTPLTLDDARRLIQIYVDHYNTVLLHSAIGYVTPQDRLAGRQAEIHAARDRKLEQARSQRQLRRQQTMSSRLAPGAAVHCKKKVIGR
jgi:hypothetical protein